MATRSIYEGPNFGSVVQPVEANQPYNVGFQALGFGFKPEELITSDTDPEVVAAVQAAQLRAISVAMDPQGFSSMHEMTEAARGEG